MDSAISKLTFSLIMMMVYSHVVMLHTSNALFFIQDPGQLHSCCYIYELLQDASTAVGRVNYINTSYLSLTLNSGEGEYISDLLHKKGIYPLVLEFAQLFIYGPS